MTVTQTTTEIQPGSFARDREQIEDEDEDDLVIVLEETGEPCDEIVVYAEPNGVEHTVDEWNEGYDPAAEGVEVVYRGTIEACFDDWIVVDVLDAFESGELTAEPIEGGYGAKTYTLPAPRLAPVGGENA